MSVPAIWQQRHTNDNNRESSLIASPPPNLLQDSQEFIMSLHQLHVENFLLFVYLQT